MTCGSNTSWTIFTSCTPTAAPPMSMEDKLGKFREEHGGAVCAMQGGIFQVRPPPLPPLSRFSRVSCLHARLQSRLQLPCSLPPLSHTHTLTHKHTTHELSSSVTASIASFFKLSNQPTFIYFSLFFHVPAPLFLPPHAI